MANARRQSTDPLERYYSRPEFVRPLTTWLAMLRDRDIPSSLNRRQAALAALNPEGLAVEPCVGHGALVTGALQTGLRSPRTPWRTVDLDPGALHAMWRGDWTAGPALWTPRTEAYAALLDRWQADAKRATLVLTNPPFSLATTVVKACWRHCPNAVVAVLQRQTWYEPTQKRAEFFCNHPPDVILIGRCRFVDADGQPVRGKDGRPGSGDNAGYAWFVWGLDRTGLAGGMTRIIPWRTQ